MAQSSGFGDRWGSSPASPKYRFVSPLKTRTWKKDKKRYKLCGSMTVSVSSLIYHFLCGRIRNNPFNKAENLSKLLRMAVTSLVESILW